MSTQQLNAHHTPASGTPVSPRRKILVLDDEVSLQQLLRTILESEGYEVLVTDDGRIALEMAGQRGVELIIQDLRMRKMDGLTFLRLLKERYPDIPAIVLTAFGTMETAVEAMRLGAYTHLPKPFDTSELRTTVSRALERMELRRKMPRSNAPFVDIISNDPAMRALSSLVDRVAPTDSTILISGESGTGKELVARAIHYGSLRCDQAFVAVNCGIFTETLLESELFGHVKGAFTNAINDHEGVFERADRGTLFLDEVGELSLTTQVKLLRVLETRTFKPVGSNHEMKVDVRFITATNRTLFKLVQEGQFREDLFYRLNVIPIHLPPLRERKGDIPLLAGHFLARFAKRMNKHVTSIEDDVMARLLAYAWPGNVRELENSIERAVALARGERVTLTDISLPTGDSGSGFHAATTPNAGRATDVIPLRTTPVPADPPSFASSSSTSLQPAVTSPIPPVVLPPEGMDLERYLLDQERAYILYALERCNGNLTEAAKLLNMTFRSIRYRVAKLGIERPGRGGDLPGVDS